MTTQFKHDDESVLSYVEFIFVRSLLYGRIILYLERLLYTRRVSSSG